MGSSAKVGHNGAMSSFLTDRFDHLKTSTAIVAHGLGSVAEFKVLNLFSLLAKNPIRDFALEKLFGPELRREVFNLWRWDARNIASGLYPKEVVPEVGLGDILHRLRIFYDILLDYPKVLRRRREGNSKIKGPPYPEYFSRTFHFQSDGYLSEKSAQLYDEQVEILFAGTADIMRRALLVELESFKDRLEHFPQVLELAAGTGAGSRLINLAYPKASVTVSDLSPYYVEYARDKLDNPFNKYMLIDATQTELPSMSYDLIFHIFLFHELPRDERVRVLEEMKRLLSPGGIAIIIDSIQIKDRPEWKELLLDFPKRYHEPFYRNYLDWDMEQAIKSVGLKVLKRSRYFLSTCLVLSN